MSGTVISRHHRPLPRALARDRAALERRDLLDAAAAGDVQAIALICDRHGAALFSIAWSIMGDPGRAESVVVDVVARACADPGATAVAATGSLRRELTRLTYLYSLRSLACVDRTRPARWSALLRMAEVAELAGQQRAAVALVQCGDHSVDDVADLIDLPVQAVAALLCAGLRDLESADRRAARNGRHHTCKVGPSL